MDNSGDLAPMTFNMPRDWHYQFKKEAARLGIPMKELLVACFDQHIAAPDDGDPSRTTSMSDVSELDPIHLASRLTAALEDLPVTGLAIERGAGSHLVVQLTLGQSDAT